MISFAGLCVFFSLLLGGFEVRRMSQINSRLMDMIERMEERMEYLEESLQDVYDFSIDL